MMWNLFVAAFFCDTEGENRFSEWEFVNVCVCTSQKWFPILGSKSNVSVLRVGKRGGLKTTQKKLYFFPRDHRGKSRTCAGGAPEVFAATCSSAWCTWQVLGIVFIFIFGRKLYGSWYCLQLCVRFYMALFWFSIDFIGSDNAI